MPTSTLTDFPPTANGGNADSESTSRAAEFGQRAAAAIDDKRDTLARGIESAASTLRDNADSLPGGEKVVSAAYTAADAMEGAADYVRDQDLRGALSDIKDIVKKHPGATLLTAAAVGFLVARSFTRDR